MARDLAAVERKLEGLIDAISEGMRGAGLQAKMDALESRKAESVAKVGAPAPATPRLHPNLSEVYRAKVERLGEALKADADTQAALDAARSLIERVVLTPLETGKGFEIELVGEIAAMVALGAGMPQATRAASGPGLCARSIKVLAGIGWQTVDFSSSELLTADNWTWHSSLPSKQRAPTIAPLPQKIGRKPPPIGA